MKGSKCKFYFTPGKDSVSRDKMVISRTLTIFVCVDFHLNREREREYTYILTSPFSLFSHLLCILSICFHFVSLSRDWKSHTCCFFLFLSFLSLERLEGSRGLGGGKEEKGRVFRSFFYKDFEVNSVWKRVFCCPRVGLYLFCLMVFPRGFFFFPKLMYGVFFSWVVVF